VSILGKSPCILYLILLRRNCSEQIVIRYYKNKITIYENIIENYDIKKNDYMVLKPVVFFLVLRFISLQNNQKLFS